VVLCARAVVSDLLVAAGSQHSFPGLTPACHAAGLTVVYMGKGPQFCAAALSGVKVVIIFADGYTDLNLPPLKPTWMQPYQEKALEEFVAAGGSFMPLHNRCVLLLNSRRF
jgi:hypothetical protein